MLCAKVGFLEPLYKFVLSGLENLVQDFAKLLGYVFVGP